MRSYECYIYHLNNNKLIQNSNYFCWAGLKNSKYYNTNIYIDKYIETEITDKQRKRIVYLWEQFFINPFRELFNLSISIN